MNPVSMPAIPTAPASGAANVPGAGKTAAVARGQASRDAQAAFSPALLLMLMAGVQPPVVKAPALNLAGGVPVPQPGAPEVKLDAQGGKIDPATVRVARPGVPAPVVATTFAPALAAVPAPVMARASVAPGSVALAQTAASVAADATAALDAATLDAATLDAAAVKSAAGNATAHHAVPVPATLPGAAPSVDPALAHVQADAATPALPVVPQGLASQSPLPLVPLQVATLSKSSDAAEPRPGTGEQAPATGAAVVEVVRRAAAVAARPGSQKQSGGQDTKQNGGESASSRSAAAGRDAASRPTGLAKSAAAAAAAPAPTPDARAAIDASTTVTKSTAASSSGGDLQPIAGAPADPRLTATDAANVRGTQSDQITLRVEDEQGTEARLRVAVRGRDVRATIVADDPAVAKRLEDGLGTLRQALGDRGFDRATVAVQSTTTARDNAGNNGNARDGQNSRRQSDTESNTTNGRRSDTPDQRSRRRGGRDAGER